MTHLWYLSALFFALILLYFIEKIPKSDIICAILLVFLLLSGIYFDEYCGIYPNEFLLSLRDRLEIIGGARHALFFALPMLIIGKLLSKSKKIMNMPAWLSLLLAAVSFALSFGECKFLFSRLGIYITNDLTLFNFLPAVFLFVFCFGINKKFSPNINSVSLRKQADMIYFSHFMFVEIHNRITEYSLDFRAVNVVLSSCIFSFIAVNSVLLLRKKS